METIAKQIVRRLHDAGFSAYWVGGCVRDLLRGQTPKDYDIATSARPEQVEALFSHTIPVGRQFGVMLVMEQGIQFEVATFRAESDYADGRHPSTVQFADARADALRRDFTVNGLFYDPIERQLYDWVGGEADIKAKIIRSIGDPSERFGEDHLRLLRAVRFAAQLNFQIEPATFAALQEKAEKISLVSAERVREELIKLFRPGQAARGLDLLRESGLLQHVLPELSATITCDQSPEFHPEGTVYNHIRLMLDKLPAGSDALLPWAVIFHDIAKPVTASRDEATGAIHFYGHEKVGARMAEQILRRLRFPRRDIEAAAEVVYYHMQFKDVQQMRKSTVRRLLMRPTFPLEMELHRLDCLGSHGSLENYEFLRREQQTLASLPEIRPPLLTGSDLIDLGMKPGPEMGRLLTEIRDRQLAEELQTRDQALAWAATYLAEEKSAG